LGQRPVFTDDLLDGHIFCFLIFSPLTQNRPFCVTASRGGGCV
jgi:hypothetical protein